MGSCPIIYPDLSRIKQIHAFSWSVTCGSQPPFRLEQSLNSYPPDYWAAFAFSASCTRLPVRLRYRFLSHRKKKKWEAIGLTRWDLLYKQHDGLGSAYPPEDVLTVQGNNRLPWPSPHSAPSAEPKRISAHFACRNLRRLSAIHICYPCHHSRLPDHLRLTVIEIASRFSLFPVKQGRASVSAVWLMGNCRQYDRLKLSLTIVYIDHRLNWCNRMFAIPSVYIIMYGRLLNRPIRRDASFSARRTSEYTVSG